MAKKKGEGPTAEEQVSPDLNDSTSRPSGPARNPGERSAGGSGASLASDLREILSHDPELDAADIGVEVEGGLVTLSGTVHSSDEKLLAEELVESVSGVREVHNHLSCADGPQPTRHDALPPYYRAGPGGSRPDV